MDRFILLMVFQDCETSVINVVQRISNDLQNGTQDFEDLVGLQQKRKTFWSTLKHGETQEKENQDRAKDSQCTAPVWEDVSNFNAEELNQTIQYLTKTGNTSIQTEHDCAVMTESLHSLADQLPYTGFYLDIVWIGSHSDVESNLPLYGALKRLIECHNGHLTMIQPTDQPSACSRWVEVLGGKLVIQDSEMLVNTEEIWRGNICIADAKTDNSLRLPGFSLLKEVQPPPKVQFRVAVDEKSEGKMKKKGTKSTPTPNHIRPVYLHQMEFLDEVAMASVPLFMCSNIKYKLCLKQGFSNATSKLFMDRINERKQHCSIVRLRHGFSDAPLHSDSVMTTHKWKHWVMEGRNVPEECSLSCQTSCDTFLLMSSANPDSDVCYAYRLHKPGELNGQIIHNLVQNSLYKKNENERNTETEMELDYEGDFHEEDSQSKARCILQGLPLFSADFLEKFEQNVKEVQAFTLKKWIEHRKSQGLSVTMSYQYLSNFMRRVKDAYFELVQKDTIISQLQLQDCKSVWRAVTQELDMNPDEWIEREALEIAEQKVKKLQRLKSTDSALGVPKDESIPLNAEEFLKHFTSDGQAMAGDLKPVKPLYTRKTITPTVDLSTIEWPASKSHPFHDIYYNNSVQAERLEARCSKIRDRCLSHETSSTCTLEKANSPATMAELTRPARLTKEKVKVNAELSNVKVNPQSSKFKVISEPSEVKVRPVFRHSDRGRAKVMMGTSDSSKDGGSKFASPTRKHKMLDIKSKAPVVAVNKSQATSQPKVPKTKLNSAVERARKTETESRSARHRRKLEAIVEETLKSNGISPENQVYAACNARLYRLTKSYVMDLTTSRNLKEEMKKIAEDHVQHVIGFEIKRMQALQEGSI